MLYMLQVIIYTGFMLAVYGLFLRNRPIHAFNRAYLLLCLLVPPLLPLVVFSGAWSATAPVVSSLGIRLPEVQISPRDEGGIRPALNLVFGGYLFVCLVLSAFTVYRFIKLYRVIRNGNPVVSGDLLLLYNTGYGPGSWMRYIFLPQGEANETVLAHETAHVRLRHSADVMLADAMRILFWPNVFLYWLKRELVQVHEFQADAAVAKDKEAYAHILLSAVFGTCTLPFSHSFIIHPLKRRIMMLNKHKGKMSFISATVACLAVAFLLFNVVALQSCKRKTWEAQKTVAVNENTDTWKGEAVKQLDKQPECPYNMMQELSARLKYPEAAMSSETEGRITVSFVVSETGDIANAQVVTANLWKKGADASVASVAGNTQADPQLSMAFETAALNAVNGLPAWAPGEKDGKKVPVEMHLPISFKL